MSTRGIDKEGALRQEVLRQKKFVEQRNKELKRIDKMLRDQENLVRKNSQHQIATIRQDHKLKELDQLNKHKKNLKDYQAHLLKQKDNLDKQHLKTRALLTDKISKEKTFQNQRLSEEQLKGFQSFTDLNQKTNKFLENLKEDLNHQRKMATIKTANSLDHANYQNRQKIEEQRKNFEKMMGHKKDQFEKAILRGESEHKEALSMAKNRHEMTIFNNKLRWEKELKNQEKFYNQLMLQTRQGFEQKFSELKKLHQSTINNLKKQSQGHIENIKKSNTKLKKLIDERSEDAFYSGKYLRPKVVDRPREYIIELKVPSHEKDRVILTGNGRQIRITQSRDLKQKVGADDGSTNETTRSESYTKTFNVPDIIDQTDIKQKYNNGILSFIIAKK